MHQDPIPTFHRIRTVKEILRGDTFHEAGRGHLVTQGSGELHQLLGRVDAFLAVGSQRRNTVDHPLSGNEVGDLGANRFDNPNGLETKHAG